MNGKNRITTFSSGVLGLGALVVLLDPAWVAVIQLLICNPAQTASNALSARCGLTENPAY